MNYFTMLTVTEVSNVIMTRELELCESNRTYPTRVLCWPVPGRADKNEKRRSWYLFSGFCPGPVR